MKQHVTGSRTFMLAAAVTASLAAGVHGQSDPELDAEASAARSLDGGWYAKASGLIVDQRSSALRDNTGAIDAQLSSLYGLTTDDFSLAADTGYGLSLGAGYDFEETPLALELEYSFRTADFDRINGPSGTSADAGGDFDSHSLMLNGLAEWQFDENPMGVYGGAGLGATRTSAALTSIGGAGTGLSSDSDTTFSWQVMAGLTVDLGDRTRLYGGVRYFDAGDVDFEVLGGKNRSVNYEVGLRIYF